jgi:hypothetical protein
MALRSRIVLAFPALLALVLLGPKIIRHSRALSFQKIGSVLVDPTKGIDLVNQGALKKQKNGQLIWTEPYFGVSGSMDWSAYDYLELTVFNTGNEAVSGRFEVKDADTGDYWTRVNQPQVIGPGLQTIKLPTKLRVGEPGRPGRPLESSRVTSFVFAREDEKNHTPIEIRLIELKKAPVYDQNGILSFDVGPQDTALFDGFQALTDKNMYTPEKTWGWMDNSKFWMPYPQINRLLGPDRLTADNLTISSATLRVDLKPGNYKVWMIIDHPGGFWGEYPYYVHRTVRAQNKIAVDERMTPEDSKAEYFKWQDAEDQEGEDIFERYWDSILKEKSFEVEVKNDHLDLGFDNEGCPDRLPCFGLALSALVIFPVDTTEQRNRGELWLKQVHDNRKAEFKNHYQLKSNALTNLLKDLPAGLHVWNVSSNTELADAKAGDLHDASSSRKMQLSAFRNSRTVLAPLISWKGKTPQEVSWRVEHLPQQIAPKGGWIKFRAMRDSYTGNLYAIKERWVTEAKKHVLKFEDMGRLWLRFPISKDAKPGLYKADLVISSTDGKDIRVPFELRVFKSKAEDLDFPVGPFGSNINENWWDDQELQHRKEELEIKSLKKMRELGMTAFSFNPQMRVSLKGEQLSLDTHEVDRVMDEAKKMGFQALVGYNNIFVGENLCRDGAQFKHVADALEARAKENNWLPLTLIVCDEPVGADLTALLDRLEGLSKGTLSGKQRKVHWSVTTSLGKFGSPENQKLVREVDLPFLSEFSENEIKFPWGYYNSTSRKTLGLQMFHLRQTTDLKYRMMWVWNQNLANPYFAFDAREDDLAWCSSLENADLRCTVDLDRVIDRGITDYRIALTLKHQLEKNQHLSAEQKAEGKALLKETASDQTDPDAWSLRVGNYLEKF